MAPRLQIPHRGFQIIAAEVGGKPLAQVFVGKSPANRERFDGHTLEEAADYARSWIDKQRKAEIDSRHAPHVARAEEYARFLQAHQHDLTDKQWKALYAHAAAPDRILSATQIAEAVGWPDYNTTNLQYGMLGRQVAEALELTLPPSKAGIERTATFALADGADPDWQPGDGHFRWRMHEELAEALRAVPERS